MRAIIDHGPFPPRQAHEGRAGGLSCATKTRCWTDLQQKVNSGELHKCRRRRIPEGAARFARAARAISRIAMLVGRRQHHARLRGDDGASDDGIRSTGFDRLLRAYRRRFQRGWRGGAHRFAGRRSRGFRRDVARDEPAEQEEAGGDLDVRRGRFRRLLHGHDRRPHRGLSRTETGSIGVVFGKPNLHGLYDKLGITKDVIARGQASPASIRTTPIFPPDGAAKLKEGIDENYRDFVAKVAEARHRPFDQIEPLAQGPRLARRAGQSARPGGRTGRASTGRSNMVKQKARIPASENVTIVMYPARRSILDVLMHRPTDDALESKLAQIFGPVPFHAWMKGGMLRVMPYWLTVK